MHENYKILLDESEMPTQWYNIVADLPEAPPPALHPGTHQPATAEDFAPLFPKALIEQEMSAERYIDIPGDVLDVYRLWRPSPSFAKERTSRIHRILLGWLFGLLHEKLGVTSHICS